MIEIRREALDDRDAIYQLNMAAFDDGPEADLVNRLRASCDDYLAFVAIDNDSVVGHILFTPTTVEGHSVVGMGLAPMAVAPDRQKHGIGSSLVETGIETLRQRNCPFVIVLGHPDYYPRFGFEPASKHGLSSQWDGVPDEAFMVMVMDPSAMEGVYGVASYRAEFDEAM